jgi:hypothetical protein
MKQFLALTSILALTLALSGVAFGQKKHARQKTAPTKISPAATPGTTTSHTSPAHDAKPEGKTAEGQVRTVDAKTKSLTLAEGSKSVLFVWDNTTKMTEAGHAVKQSALVAGAKVTVHYLEKGGKNWASAIIISPPRRAARRLK